MKTTIDMAREVKMPYDFVTGEPINIEKLKAFEELVRSDEREQIIATQPAVPDAIADRSETPEYSQGWNDCRQAMLAA